MRSSKSRSRSKSNRSRSIGNIVNRVFDSSGPEGKVRGTPQQIIDKYTQLARDAALANDRVATENFQQHAEHYTRMLGEAQREQDARREQEQANRDRQRDRFENGGDDRRESQQSEFETIDDRDSEQPDVIEDNQQGSDQPDIVMQPAPSDGAQVVGDDEEADSGLVETPESKPKPKPRSRSPRSRKPRAQKAGADDPQSGEAGRQAPDGRADPAEVAD